jgi:hypothetical protein
MNPITFMQMAKNWRERADNGQLPDYLRELELLCRETEQSLRDDEMHDFVSEQILGISFR